MEVFVPIVGSSEIFLHAMTTFLIDREGSSLHLASVVIIIGELLSMIRLLNVLRLTCARSKDQEEYQDGKYNPLEHGFHALRRLIDSLKRVRWVGLETLAVGEFTTSIAVSDVV